MKKNIKKIQIFRHAIQLILFVLSPALFILAFSELKSIYEMISKGNFNFLQVFPSLIEFLTAIIATVLFGRFFCGWVCAFGTYNDLLHLLSKKVFNINFKVNEKVDAALKYVKYIVLLLLVILVWTMGSTVLDSTSPWDAFAQITDFPQVLSNYAIGFILLILITVGAFFVERFFCRYLCPLGAVFNIFSKIGILKIKKPTDKCGSCRLCTSNCAMALPLYKVESVCGGDCINCLKCVETCPKKNTQVNVLGENVNPEMASSVAIAAMVGLYAVNNLGGTVLAKSGIATVDGTSISTSVNNSTVKYADGTYTGTGTGFKRGTTKISVTIKNGKITSIKTISNQDTPKFYQGVENTITSEIISAQSTSVDTVSGATYSCNGIINAVKDALAQATSSVSASTASSSTTDVSNDSTNGSVASANSSAASTDANTASANSSAASTNANTASTNSSAASTNANTTSANSNVASTKSNTTSADTNTADASNTATDSKVTTTKPTTTTQSKYADGTYTGTGTGFKRGTTKIAVTIQNDKITSIKTVSNQDTPRYYQRVENTMISGIISAQSTSVDTVSGATYSCNGIINAVKDALSQAKA